MTPEPTHTRTPAPTTASDASAQTSERAPSYDCDRCKDTRTMYIGEDHGPFMCTSCPRPCDSCRQGAKQKGVGLGPFCEVVPCPCPCHPKNVKAAADSPPAPTTRASGPTKAERDALRALEARATPGPWCLDERVGQVLIRATPRTGRCTSGDRDVIASAVGERVLNDHGEFDHWTVPDWRTDEARLLAAARNALIGLLDAADERDAIAGTVENLRHTIESLRKETARAEAAEREVKRLRSWEAGGDLGARLALYDAAEMSDGAAHLDVLLGDAILDLRQAMRERDEERDNTRMAHEREDAAIRDAQAAREETARMREAVAAYFAARDVSAESLVSWCDFPRAMELEAALRALADAHPERPTGEKESE